MIPKFCAAFLVLLVMAAVCVAADPKPVSDDAIYDQVRIKLASDAVVKGGALKVDVKQGVVTLSGDLEQEKQSDRATKIAKRVKGVKEVVNNITIKQRT